MTAWSVTEYITGNPWVGLTGCFEGQIGDCWSTRCCSTSAYIYSDGAVTVRVGCRNFEKLSDKHFRMQSVFRFFGRNNNLLMFLSIRLKWRNCGWNHRYLECLFNSVFRISKRQGKQQEAKRSITGGTPPHPPSQRPVMRNARMRATSNIICMSHLSHCQCSKSSGSLIAR